MDCQACIAEDRGGYTVSWKLHAVDCGVYENGLDNLRNKIEENEDEGDELVYCPACHAEGEVGALVPWHQHASTCPEYKFGLALEQQD